MSSFQEDEVVKHIVAILLINSQMGLTDNDLLHEYEVLVGHKLLFPVFNYSNLKDFLSRHPERVEIYNSKFGNRYKAVEYDDESVQRNFHRHDELASAFKGMKVCSEKHCKSDHIVPYDVRKNLLDIIEKYPTGIDLEIFLLEFCELCGYELQPHNFNFTSYQQMFLHLSDIFSLHPTEKSILLYPTSQVVKPGVGSGQTLSCTDQMDLAKQRVVELMRVHGSCMKLGDLQTEYFSYFGTYLNVENVGFASVLDFLFHCQDCFDMKDSGDSRDEIVMQLKPMY